MQCNFKKMLGAARPPNLRPLLGHLLVFVADRARDLRRYEAAVAIYRAALSYVPDHYGAWIQLANILKDTGRFAEAEEAYRTALGLAPEHFDVHRQMGHLFRMTGRRAESADCFLRAAELAPNHPLVMEPLAGIGLARRALGTPRDASYVLRETGERPGGAGVRLIELRSASSVPAGWYEARISGTNASIGTRVLFGFDDWHPNPAFTRMWRDDDVLASIIRLPVAIQAAEIELPLHSGYGDGGELLLRRIGSATLTARAAIALSGMRERGGLSPAPRDFDRYSQGRRGFATVDLDWGSKFDFDPDRELRALEQQLALLPMAPLVSVLMVVHDTPEAWLDAALASLAAQVHAGWELIVIDNGASALPLEALLERWRERDARIKPLRAATVLSHEAAMCRALEAASGELIAVVWPVDRLCAHALAEIVLAAAARPDAQLIYSDEDHVDENGARFGLHFKPDIAPDMLRSWNYIGRLAVYRREALVAVGAWREEFAGNADFELNLRILDHAGAGRIVHVPRIHYHSRVGVDASHAMPDRGDARRAGVAALRAHLARNGMQAEVSPLDATGRLFRVRHHVPEPAPLVSLIIPTRDGLDILRPCVASILERTTYSDYEVIVVDNDSRMPETLRYLEEIVDDRRVRVLRAPGPFNYSAINNEAVRHARGSIIGFINNDIEVITPDWLEEMVSWASQPRIGCVGAKLLYPDNTVQHAGVIIGIGGHAGHAHRNYDRSAGGYFGRLRIAQNVSAVTAACLVARKAVFDEVGGFDADYLTIGFNDIDLCMKVAAAGYLNVWTPFAELYHHESKSRGIDNTPEKVSRAAREMAVMKARWRTDEFIDPYYSINLTRTEEDFSIRED